MSLPTTRRALGDDLRDMNKLLNRILDPSADGFDLGRGLELSAVDGTPSIDIGETDRAYWIRANLPQMKREELEVHVQDGMLVLTGERKQDKEEESGKWHRTERSYGSFAHSFRLPEDVDAAAIDATYNDGVLELTLPKSAKPKGNGHPIEIH